MIDFRYPNQKEMIDMADNHPKGWIMCDCQTIQGCHTDSICAAKEKCVCCIIENYWNNDTIPGPKRIVKHNDGNSDSRPVLVHFLTKGKQARGV